MALRHIPFFWLSENDDSKVAYDQFTEKVTISTIFSGKGLEFPIVYIVGLELFPWQLRNPRENASLLYVAMTRARERVVLLSTEENQAVHEIREAVEEVAKIQP